MSFDAPHVGFVLWSYATAVFGIGGLLLFILADYRRQRQLLSTLDPTGENEPGGLAGDMP